MKILFIAPLPLPVTGQSLACKLLFDSLCKKGYDIELVNLSKGTFKNGASSFLRLFEIARILCLVILKKRGCSLVYFNPSESIAGNLKDLIIYMLLGKQLRNTVVHLHGGAGMKVILSPRHKWLLKFNSKFLSKLKGAIVLGGRLAPIYRGIVEDSKIHIVKNFAPDDVFISAEQLQAKFLKMDPLRVLFLSNLIPGKGYEELVEAIGLLKPDVRNKLMFDFAGGFETEEAKSRFLTSIAGWSNATYYGVVHGEEKRQLLHDAHVFALPTYYPFEGQPISILEAYAAGCSVITTDHSGIFDIFEPGKNGQDVTKGSAASLAIALETAVLNHGKIRDFGIKNSKVAQELYRAGNHLEELTRCLDLSDVPGEI